MLRLFVLILASSLATASFAAERLTEPAAPAAWMASPSGPAKPPALLAQHRKRKKKKKKKDEVATPSTDAQTAGGLHGAQEGGTDEPYKWEVSLTSDLRIHSDQAGDADPAKTALYELGGRALYLVTDSIEVGPELEYAESTFKAEDSSTTSQTYLLSLIGKFNFGDLNEDETIFFVRAAFGIGAEKGKAGDVKTDASVTQYGLGLGMHYFVDTNVAFTGELGYDAGSKKVKDADDPVKTTDLHILKLGFSLFI